MACQVFEGSEKRLEIDFITNEHSPSTGLRCLSREQLDTLLDRVSNHTASILGGSRQSFILQLTSFET